MVVVAAVVVVVARPRRLQPQVSAVSALAVVVVSLRN